MKKEKMMNLILERVFLEKYWEKRIIFWYLKKLWTGFFMNSKLINNLWNSINSSLRKNLLMRINRWDFFLNSIILLICFTLKNDKSGENSKVRIYSSKLNMSWFNWN